MKATQPAVLQKAFSQKGSRTDLPAPFLPLWDPNTVLAHPKLCSPSPTRSLPPAPHAEWASVGSSGPPPKSLPPILTRLPLLGASSFSPDQEKVRNCSCYFRKIHGTSGLGPFFTCGSEVSADEACANCSLSLSLTLCCGILACWPLAVTSAGPWTKGWGWKSHSCALLRNPLSMLVGVFWVVSPRLVENIWTHWRDVWWRWALTWSHSGVAGSVEPKGNFSCVFKLIFICPIVGRASDLCWIKINYIFFHSNDYYGAIWAPLQEYEKHSKPPWLRAFTIYSFILGKDFSSSAACVLLTHC